MWQSFLAFAIFLPLASGVVAEPAPFWRVVGAAVDNPDMVFVDPSGAYFALDPNSNLAWMIDEEGKFLSLFSLTAAGSYIDVSADGDIQARFGNADLLNWQVAVDLIPILPSSRSVFQTLPGAKLTKAAGSLLPIGSQFDGYFSVTTPDGRVLAWRPSSDASGILVSDLVSNEVEIIDMTVLGAAIAVGE